MDVNRPAPRLTLDTLHDDEGAYVITASGEIDLDTVAQLRACVDAVLQAAPTSLAFAVAGVEFIDSSGVAVFIEAARSVPVHLVEPSRQVRRVVELSGLAAILPVRS